MQNANLYLQQFSLRQGKKAETTGLGTFCESFGFVVKGQLAEQVIAQQKHVEK